MPNYAERYATARCHYAELCRIMLLCRLCRTHAIMPIYYAGIKWHAQLSSYRPVQLYSVLVLYYEHWRLPLLASSLHVYSHSRYSYC